MVKGPSLSVVLRAFTASHSGDRVYVSDLLNALGDRALSALLFIFAFPTALPMPPGTSAVLGIPLIFLAFQLTFGLKPWLPGTITKRSMSLGSFQTLIDRVVPWLERAEKLLRPRASRLALPPMEYVMGTICLFLSVVLILPIPLGNNLPALAISMLALGLLERDGYWILAGLVATVVATAVASGMIIALVKTAFFVSMTLLA